MEDSVYENILDAQVKQKSSYAKRHPQPDGTFKKGDEVLLRNLRLDEMIAKEVGFLCHELGHSF